MIRWIFVFLVPFFSLNAQDLTQLEKRGQHIYKTGTLPEGDPIPAFLGDSKDPIPSRLFACTNCHGPDGKGVPEGGVKPSNITWHGLTKPYGAISGTHRDRPPYNEQQIWNAIRKGVDPLGSHLETSMPRYKLSEKDSEAIIAYLKIIHRIDDPGVSSDSLRIGLVLPPSINYQPLQEVLQQYFNKINQEGGIYRRKIQVVILNLDDNPRGQIKQWEEFIQKKDLFLLLSPFLQQTIQGKIEDLCLQHRIPVISPFVITPIKDEIPNPYIFYFFPSLETQLKTLSQFANNQFSPSAPLNQLNVEELKKLKHAGIKALVLRTKRTNLLLDLLTEIDWHPTLLLPHLYKTPDLDNYPGEFYVSSPYPSIKQPDDPVVISKSTLSAAEIIHSILLQIGRKLTRVKVIAQLESYHNKQSGWSGPLTFNPNRRVGPLGAYIHHSGSPDHLPTWINLRDKP